MLTNLFMDIKTQFPTMFLFCLFVSSLNFIGNFLKERKKKAIWIHNEMLFQFERLVPFMCFPLRRVCESIESLKAEWNTKPQFSFSVIIEFHFVKNVCIEFRKGSVWSMFTLKSDQWRFVYQPAAMFIVNLWEYKKDRSLCCSHVVIARLLMN